MKRVRVHKRVHSETLPHGAVLLWLTISPSSLLNGAGKEILKWGGECVFLLNKARSLLFPSTCRAQALKSVDMFGEKNATLLVFESTPHSKLFVCSALCSPSAAARSGPASTRGFAAIGEQFGMFQITMTGSWRCVAVARMETKKSCCDSSGKVGGGGVTWTAELPNTTWRRWKSTSDFIWTDFCFLQKTNAFLFSFRKPKFFQLFSSFEFVGQTASWDFRPREESTETQRRVSERFLPPSLVCSASDGEENWKDLDRTFLRLTLSYVHAPLTVVHVTLASAPESGLGWVGRMNQGKIIISDL